MVVLGHDKRVSVFAAQEIASTRNGGAFCVDRFPDEIDRTNKAVDLIGHDDYGTIVAEHTVIESYSHQLHDSA
jgi:hypothetical protein